MDSTEFVLRSCFLADWSVTEVTGATPRTVGLPAPSGVARLLAQWLWAVVARVAGSEPASPKPDILVHY